MPALRTGEEANPSARREGRLAQSCKVQRNPRICPRHCAAAGWRGAVVLVQAAVCRHSCSLSYRDGLQSHRENSPSSPASLQPTLTDGAKEDSWMHSECFKNTSCYSTVQEKIKLTAIRLYSSIMSFPR